ncbi:hypothetical protein OAM67_01700 [bacterium]|nr:hypothetical protein [bacterium]
MFAFWLDRLDPQFFAQLANDSVAGRHTVPWMHESYVWKKLEQLVAARK